MIFVSFHPKFLLVLNAAQSSWFGTSTAAGATAGAGAGAGWFGGLFGGDGYFTAGRLV